LGEGEGGGKKFQGSIHQEEKIWSFTILIGRFKEGRGAFPAPRPPSHPLVPLGLEGPFW